VNGFRVKCLGLRVKKSGFRVTGFRVKSLGILIPGLGLRF